MTTKNYGGPAFPSGPQMTLNADRTWPAMTIPQMGMSLRDYFAAAALPHVITPFTFSANEYSYDVWVNKRQEWRASCAADAYLMADAMLKEREK